MGNWGSFGRETNYVLRKVGITQKRKKVEKGTNTYPGDDPDRTIREECGPKSAIFSHSRRTFFERRLEPARSLQGTGVFVGDQRGGREVDREMIFEKRQISKERKKVGKVQLKRDNRLNLRYGG